ncbi:hypothetical protein FXO37_03398 [Capsicum annuum]|nr:hypothetical protein FXO37_03398 [Capsicum annuum]
MIGQDYVVHWELKRGERADIKRLISISCYRGICHQDGCPYAVNEIILMVGLVASEFRNERSIPKALDSEDEPADPNIIYEEPDDQASSSDKDVSDATLPARRTFSIVIFLAKSGHHLGWEWLSPHASFDESTPVASDDWKGFLSPQSRCSLRRTKRSICDVDHIGWGYSPRADLEARVRALDGGLWLRIRRRAVPYWSNYCFPLEPVKGLITSMSEEGSYVTIFGGKEDGLILSFPKPTSAFDDWVGVPIGERHRESVKTPLFGKKGLRHRILLRTYEPSNLRNRVQHREAYSLGYLVRELASFTASTPTRTKNLFLILTHGIIRPSHLPSSQPLAVKAIGRRASVGGRMKAFKTRLQAISTTSRLPSSSECRNAIRREFSCAIRAGPYNEGRIGCERDLAMHSRHISLVLDISLGCAESNLLPFFLLQKRDPFPSLSKMMNIKFRRLQVRLGKGSDPTHGRIKGSKSGSLFILFIGRISPIVQAQRFGVGNLIPLEELGNIKTSAKQAMSFIREVDRAIIKRLSSILGFHKARILCHRIGCALPLLLYQKITLCERLTLNFSQWEESPYLRMTIGLCSIRNKYPVSVSTLQRLVGMGFRIRSCLFLTQSKRWERLKATFCKPNRSHPLPLEWWIGSTTWKRSNKDFDLIKFGLIWKCYDMGVDWDLSTTPRWLLDPNTVIQFDRWIYGGILGGDFMMAPVGLPSPVKGRRP